jgi:thiol-disulfide isomerase/thioredoxin
MKKILILLLTAVAIFSCKEEAPKDYVSLQGKISNSDSDKLMILGRGFKKEIKVNEDGSFKDTLKVTNGFHGFNFNSKQSSLYLKNGFDLTLDFDTKDFPNSIEFTGDGANTNDYLTKKIAYVTEKKLMNPEALLKLEKGEFDTTMEGIKNDFDDMLKDADDLDPEFLEKEKESNKRFLEYFNTNYAAQSEYANSIKKGADSPKFNYPDTNGKNVSLDDFKGKYVYVDVWATWCGPCKGEIPFLKKLDEEYKGKKIVFVSLSIDEMKNKDKWLKMVKDENLQGVQIMADKAWNSDFVKAYNIRGIPRFILIDKEGKILNDNAPRPSNPNLKELFNSLDI